MMMMMMIKNNGYDADEDDDEDDKTWWDNEKDKTNDHDHADDEEGRDENEKDDVEVEDDDDDEGPSSDHISQGGCDITAWLEVQRSWDRDKKQSTAVMRGDRQMVKEVSRDMVERDIPQTSLLILGWEVWRKPPDMMKMIVTHLNEA